MVGNLAQLAGEGKKVEWDGANMRCTNLPELNEHVRANIAKAGRSKPRKVKILSRIATVPHMKLRTQVTVTRTSG